MGSVVDTVVHTVLTSQQVNATPQQRAAAVQLFQQLKSGELRSSASVGAELIKTQQPIEVQVLGYGLLQHLVGNRWEEFTAEEQSQLATLSYAMLKEVGGQGGWAARSKASLLLALVIKRSGAELWEAALPQFVALATEGPALQEEVCMVLKYVADEVTQYADDIQAEHKRLLLAALTKSLSVVLPFLERTLEQSFSAASDASRAGQQETAQQHVAALQAALGAVATYAEWAPLTWLQQSGLIGACGFLLGTLDFRESACDVLRLIAGRKQAADETAEVVQEGMQQLAAALAAAAAALLSPSAAQELDYEGANDEFGRQLCEAMAAVAPHFSAVKDPEKRLAFLQHMVTFAQHPYLLLADKALPFWVKLLQDVASAATSSASPSAAGSAGGAGASQPDTLLPPEAVSALMDMAAEQLLKRGAHVPQEQDQFPPYFDTFPEYKEFMVQYRAKLSLVVRSAAALLPEQALMAAGRRLEAAAAACSSPGRQLDEARTLLEAAVYFMESTFKAVWDDSVLQQPAKLHGMVGVTEPMLQRTLSLRVSDPAMLQHQARGLEAFGKLLAARPNLLPAALGRVLELLVGVVPLEDNGQQPPPGKPPPGWREGLQARQSVAMVVLAWAKESPSGFLPHLEGLATRVKELWDQGQIRAGEKNVISEALLGAAVAGPEQLQASVVEWVLSPVRHEWAQPSFQATLASPQAFISHYLPVQPDPAGGYQVGGQTPRWQLYHQVHLLERGVRRLAGAGGEGGRGHPLAPHADWALPVMLRIIGCLHAVFTPAGRQMLAPVVAVLEMSAAEKALYLKKGQAGRAHKAAVDEDNDGDYASVGGTTVGSIRAWLRHIREFLYQSLGLLPANCPPALECQAVKGVFAPAVFSYVESLDHPQLRIILRHITIPHIKTCPPPHLPTWLAPALSLLAPHMHARLTGAWGGLQAQQVEGPSKEDSASANEEIIRDRVVRELTQEYALLLQELSSRRVEDPPGGGAGAGGGQTPAQQGGAQGPPAGGRHLLEWLMESDPSTGFVMLTTAVEGMMWKDESAFRFAMFCRTMVGLAPRDQRLYAFVGSEMLRAAIASLASEALATHQVDLLSLIRSILVQQINDAASACGSVLASLPGMTADRLEAFTGQLFGTGSEKSQRDAIKKMLLACCGRGSFAGLADWKPSASVVVSVPKQRSAQQGTAAEDHPDVFFNQIFQ